ncbi:hypothetical protein A3D88_04785 [Candidatus Peribacteria bacterium RIFCSPHIGHO2_02_FULL_52_16]|nr:MAG: hypothetical protein A2706_04775 [Candidatus Peribacteria bacterium RIFCSPHIGHO2_01_FULL_51_35]OGJ60597.1 MAG: hypothetical protein A3D88_04785 [Candidatus Peribacteria bacterium RIFCSPHIGHO2_02_FULL_52_16]
MDIRLLTSVEDLTAYDLRVKSHPQGQLWQSLEWKKYQEALGRDVRIYQDDQSSALVVIDRTAFGLSTWDVPRGPLTAMDNGQLTMNNVLEYIVSEARKDKSLSVYFSPLKPIVHCPLSVVHSVRHEQPQATRIIDLTKSEEEILAQMHQKGRYNIKVAEKHGVMIEQSQDIDAFYELMKKTSERDRFGKHSKNHYGAMLKHLPGAFLMIAQHDKKPIAGLMGVLWNGLGVYYYGASSHAYRALMAPYALQWAAMRHCKASGYHSYDLFGIAPPSSDSSHPWVGISDFKAKFGGQVIEYPPEREIVIRPLLKTLLSLKRKLFR